ncbi:MULTISPECIES: hypothetical protein [Streptomyces]|nr:MULTISPECIES: hypothetical protein [Streptomyces]MCE7081733.1 hypothetical protein [Streptomyces sp. ST2-7A]
MEQHTDALDSDPAEPYAPALVTVLGSVSAVTLGWLSKDKADDTEYWY